MHQFEKWRESIARATSLDDVIAIIEQYVAGLPQAVLDVMPADCREALRDDDIAGAAVTLLRCELTFAGSDEARKFLHEIAHTFTAASSRMSLIRHRAPPGKVDLG